MLFDILAWFGFISFGLVAAFVVFVFTQDYINLVKNSPTMYPRRWWHWWHWRSNTRSN